MRPAELADGLHGQMGSTGKAGRVALLDPLIHSAGKLLILEIGRETEKKKKEYKALEPRTIITFSCGTDRQY